MANEQGIKVKDLEQAARIREGNRLLILTDEENNEVKTVTKENAITSLISTAENNLITDNGGFFVDGNVLAELAEALRQIQAQQADEIARPIFTLSNTLLDNEIWLEGGLIDTSNENYTQIVNIYGTTYNNGTEPEGFIRLPDFRNRTIWGASNFGYISAGLPNITGGFGVIGNEISYPEYDLCPVSGAFSKNWLGGNTKSIENTNPNTIGKVSSFNFEASRSNAVYGASNTVQPPAIKVRVKTRFK